MEHKHAEKVIDDIMQNFSQVVRSRRLDLGLSQEALALRSNLHRTYISDVECGIRNVSLKTLFRLSAALNIEASELLKLAETEAGTSAAPKRRKPVSEDSNATLELLKQAACENEAKSAFELMSIGEEADVSDQTGRLAPRMVSPTLGDP
jgi:transcriptional regulator with XRE-family HTH domain